MRQTNPLSGDSEIQKLQPWINLIYRENKKEISAESKSYCINKFR